MKTLKSTIKNFFAALFAAVKAIFIRSEDTPAVTLSANVVDDAKYQDVANTVALPETYGPALPLPKYFCYLLKERGIDINARGGPLNVRFLRWLHRTDFIFSWTNEWFCEIEQRYAKAQEAIWHANTALVLDWRVELQLDIDWAPLLSKDWISPFKAVRIMKRIAKALPSRDAIWETQKKVQQTLRKEWFDKVLKDAKAQEAEMVVFKKKGYSPYPENRDRFESNVAHRKEAAIWQCLLEPAWVAIPVENLEDFLRKQVEEPFFSRFGYEVTYT